MDLIEIGRIVAARRSDREPRVETPLERAEDRVARRERLVLRQVSLINRMDELGDRQGAAIGRCVLATYMEKYEHAVDLWERRSAVELIKVRSAARSGHKSA